MTLMLCFCFLKYNFYLLSKKKLELVELEKKKSFLFNLVFLFENKD